MLTYLPSELVKFIDLAVLYSVECYCENSVKIDFLNKAGFLWNRKIIIHSTGD